MLNRSINLFIAIFAVFVIGIETETYWYAQLRPWQPSSPVARVIFYYSFFTVLSNLMLALSCFTLFIKPKCDRFWFRVIRLNGVAGVIITALVYNLMLRGIHRPPTELLRFANESLHVVLPALGVLTWLIWGPFHRINSKVIFGSFCSLLVYGVYIFVRGYYTGLYPYPFINVNRIGYQQAFYAVAAVAVLFVILAFVLFFIDKIRNKNVPHLL